MTYNAGNEQQNINTTQFTYDLNGHRIQKNEGGITTTYTYDDENRLVQVTRGSDVITYAYDPFGRRITKAVNGFMTRYVYDQDAIIADYDSLGNVTARYAHGLNIDEPLAVQQGSVTSFYHADGLGSIVALTNTSGAVVQTYSYDSFGNITPTGSITQPYTFTAREYDSETGLYFYRARYYDPKAGRFISKDPIGFAGGDVNLYGYNSNDPINWVDPSGLWPTLMPGREDAEKQLPSILKNLVPTLTKKEASQVSQDAISKLDWSDVNAIKAVTPNLMNTSPPRSIKDLSRAQKDLLINFSSKLPDRDKSAIAKIKKACK